jgi:mannose-6-phosphate isomerase-like protein (cupin superfamily)
MEAPLGSNVASVWSVLLEDVEARAAVEDVHAGTADQYVVAVTAKQRAVPVAPDEEIVPCSAVQRDQIELAGSWAALRMSLLSNPLIASSSIVESVLVMFTVAARPGDVGRAAPPSARKAEQDGMHRTPSVDLICLLSGEIWLELDAEEVDLREGDFVVQNGTKHAWRNKGDRPCRMTVVVVGAGHGDQATRAVSHLAAPRSSTERPRLVPLRSGR